MLLVNVICTNCGAQIGACSLLYFWLRNRRNATAPPQAYSDVNYRDIAEQAGLVNDCCWNLVHGAYTHQNRDCGIVVTTVDGAVI